MFIFIERIHIFNNYIFIEADVFLNKENSL